MNKARDLDHDKKALAVENEKLEATLQVGCCYTRFQFAPENIFILAILRAYITCGKTVILFFFSGEFFAPGIF